MVGHWGSSAGSYLADPTSPIPSHCASIVVTSTVRVKNFLLTFPIEDDPRPWSSQRLVRGRCYNITVFERTWDDSSGYQAGDVGHVCEHVSVYGVCDFTETRIVQVTRVARDTCSKEDGDNKTLKHIDVSAIRNALLRKSVTYSLALWEHLGLLKLWNFHTRIM